MSQPRNIEVFDGLRITTEHIDHLQGSVHSAIGDVRAILGLGRVYRGFGVDKSAADAVTVQPGLAFDLEQRRIVADEPRTVNVPAVTPEAPQYVCVQYNQATDGVVEGHPTMIFDSCDVVVRPSTAGVAEGHPTMIFDSCDVVVRPSAPKAPDPAIAIAKLTNDAAGFRIESLLPTVPRIEPPPPPTLRVRQGVTRLGSEAAVPFTLTDDAAPDAALTVAPTEQATIEQRIDVGFPVTTIDAQLVLSASVTAGEEAPISIEAAATGAASMQDGAFTQSGVTTGARISMSERALGELVLPIADGRARLIATVAPNGDAGFTLVGRVIVEANDVAAVRTALAERPVTLDWRVAVAWRALGIPAPARPAAPLTPTTDTLPS